MDRHSSFAKLQARLAPTCEVLLYDRRGYAQSRYAEPAAAGIDDHVEDLRGLLHGRRAVLVGHSYGGDVALALAERHPELVVAAVVFEPPLPWLDLWHFPEAPGAQPPWAAPDPAEAAERFTRRVLGDRRYEQIPAATRAEMVKDGPALVAELTAIRRDPPPFDPGRVEVPVAVVFGSETAERHQRGAEWLAARLPHAVAHMIEGAGHHGHRTHAEELAVIVLASVGPARLESDQKWASE